MIGYWVQNGETFKDKPIKDSLSKIFKNDGSCTMLSYTFFSQLRSKANNLDTLVNYIESTLEKWEGREPCSICGNPNGNKLKGWMYPFVIAKEKFPNLHPNGKVDSLHICRECAKKSVMAYGRVRFNGQRSGYLSMVVFFSTTAEKLMEFYTMEQESVVPDYYSNWGDKSDIIYHPYELLAYLLYKIASKQRSHKVVDISLGAMVFGLTTGSKKIYDTADIVDNLNPIVNAIAEFSNNYNFELLFRRLKEDSNDVDPGVSLKRNIFFKTIIKERKVGWHTLEDILFYNVSKDRNIPFIKPFLLTLMSELRLNEKEIFEQVSSIGYSIGKSLLDLKGKDKSKRDIYELRRKRRLEEFLDSINLIQIEVERSIDDRPFKENPEMFNKLKVFFLIGMSNAIFSKGDN